MPEPSRPNWAWNVQLPPAGLNCTLLVVMTGVSKLALAGPPEAATVPVTRSTISTWSRKAATSVLLVFRPVKVSVTLLVPVLAMPSV